MKFAMSAPPAKVLGLYAHPTMNVVYRLITPLRAIGGSWAPVNAVAPDQLEAAETVIWHAMGGKVADVRKSIRALRKRWGVKRIIVDYDDAPFLTHPVKAVRMKAFQVNGVRAALEGADSVIVTNEALKAHFEAHTDKPIGIVPNLIMPEDWPAIPPAAETPPVIVLAGSPSHQLDWDLVVPTMAQVRKQLPDVQFRLLGYGHRLLKQIATQGGGGWMTGPQYVKALAGGSIGLCPLPDTPFNQCKSPVKALEYSLAGGMAVIGSPTQYGELLADGRGYIAKDTVHLAWQLALGVYLMEPERRRQEAAQLRSYILATYDARIHAAALSAVYHMEDTPCPSLSLDLKALSRSAQPMP